MKRGIQIGNIRALLPLSLACALAFLNTSCVKLPRHTEQLSPQTAPLLSQAEATHAPLININTATTTELESLPGIGKGLASRIVAFREQYGQFRRAEHLLMVRGISDRRFRAMRALLTAE
jgi:competence ComEA-like helix-hairpin-helix protein